MKTFQNDIVNHRTADVASAKVLEINTDDLIFIKSKATTYFETTTPSVAPDDDQVILCDNGKTIEKVAGGSGTAGNVASTTTTDGTYKTISTIPLNDDTVYLIEASFEARRTDVEGDGIFERSGLFFREGASSAQQRGHTKTTKTIRSSGLYRVRFLLSGDNVLIQVRGAIGHTINWEVRYPINGVQ